MKVASALAARSACPPYKVTLTLFLVAQRQVKPVLGQRHFHRHIRCQLGKLATSASIVSWSVAATRR